MEDILLQKVMEKGLVKDIMRMKKEMETADKIKKLSDNIKEKKSSIEKIKMIIQTITNENHRISTKMCYDIEELENQILNLEVDIIYIKNNIIVNHKDV